MVRAFTAFVTTALLLANLATATNAYADLPDCSQHAAHTAHTDTDDHAHADAGTNTASTHDACCGTCDNCRGYFGAHLQGLNHATAGVAPPAPHMNISAPLVHATDFINRPDIPPPKSASVLQPS